MRSRKFVIVGASAIATVIIGAAAAWACVSGPSVTLTPTNAEAGDEVTATIRDIRKAEPVQARWSALDGAVLGSYTHRADGAPFTGTFRVPADASRATTS